jgi:hypothetical protein
MTHHFFSRFHGRRFFGIGHSFLSLMNFGDVGHQVFPLVELVFAEGALEKDDLPVDLLQVILQVDLGRVPLVAHVAGELLHPLVHDLKKPINVVLLSVKGKKVEIVQEITEPPLNRVFFIKID